MLTWKALCLPGCGSSGTAASSSSSLSDSKRKYSPECSTAGAARGVTAQLVPRHGVSRHSRCPTGGTARGGSHGKAADSPRLSGQHGDAGTEPRTPVGIAVGDKDSTLVSPKWGPSGAGVRRRPMPVTPNPARYPQFNTLLVLGSGEVLVSALRPSVGTGNMQGVTLPKAPSPPLPTGVSGPRRRDLTEGLRPVMAPCWASTCGVV